MEATLPMAKSAEGPRDRHEPEQAGLRGGGAVAEWPVPAELPLYATIDRAAEIAGVSRDKMREWAHDQRDPLPQMQCGRKRLVRVAALPGYLERRECV